MRFSGFSHVVNAEIGGEIMPPEIQTFGFCQTYICFLVSKGESEDRRRLQYVGCMCNRWASRYASYAFSLCQVVSEFNRTRYESIGYVQRNRHSSLNTEWLK